MSQESISLGGIHNRLRFLLNRLSERLWVKPLFSCCVSILVVFLANFADDIGILENKVPNISYESVTTLLSVMAASMLVIATFSVGAMLSAYASASDVATPRALSLVIADDVSQNALSTFIGSFIFSIVGLVAHLNTVYGKLGTFVLFVITLLVFAIVIFSFVRWVDRIARLGRLGATIGKVEDVTTKIIQTVAQHPTLCAMPWEREEIEEGVTQSDSEPVFSKTVGFVQQLDIAKLQSLAEHFEGKVYVCTLPGDFVTLSAPIAYIKSKRNFDDKILTKIAGAFRIGRVRTFDEDPRFGMVVLSEIASRALSPAVNDPGTATNIIGTMERLFSVWATTQKTSTASSIQYKSVFVTELSMSNVFDEAFSAIARDGAATREVTIKLQKAFTSLQLLGHKPIADASIKHSLYALAHAESRLTLQEDIDNIRSLAKKVNDQKNLS